MVSVREQNEATYCQKKIAKNTDIFSSKKKKEQHEVMRKNEVKEKTKINILESKQDNKGNSAASVVFSAARYSSSAISTQRG